MLNKSELYYHRQGAGVALILLPGFCESTTIWCDVIPSLGQTCEVIAIDLPGFGGNKKLEPPTSLVDVAKQIHRFILTLDIKKYIVIGHSMGGYICLELASLFPESILGIGLVHSTAIADDAEKKKTRRKIIDFVSRKGTEVFVKSFVPQLFANKKSPKIEKVIDSNKGVSSQSLINYTQAMIDRKSHQNTLTNWKKPILMIAGEYDTLIDIESSRKNLQYIPQSSYHELKEIGHMGQCEAPEVISKLVFALICTISK